MRRLIASALSLGLAVSAAAAATPPAQPRSGLPGGADRPDIEIVKRAVGHASAATYVFYTAGQPATPRPVVIFLHAWGAMNPLVYGGWIDHLARRGYIVLFPAFQDVGKTRPPDAMSAMLTLVKEALASLADDAAARPDLAKVAVLGHSAGAALAANLAAEAKSHDLPVPRLVFSVMPGGIASDPASRGIPLSDLGQVPGTTAIVTLIGDRDAQPSDRASRRILREAAEVPASRKLFLRVLSDDHGFPALSATLASAGSPKEGYESAPIKVPPDPPVDPKAPRVQRPRWSADMVLSGEQTILVQQLGRNTIDTLDYLGFWKCFDMAADAAFAGTDLAGLRTDPAFVDMGRWSDGWPVKRLVAETPRPVDASAAPVERVAPAPTKMPVTRRSAVRR